MYKNTNTIILIFDISEEDDDEKDEEVKENETVEVSKTTDAENQKWFVFDCETSFSKIDKITILVLYQYTVFINANKYIT